LYRKHLKGIAPAFAALVFASGISGHAAQLSTDARSAIPRDVQQLVVIDYRAMQNSPTAMQLRDRVMPPELKQFEEALRRSGLNDNHDVDQLAFALFRPKADTDEVVTLGVAQGQFPTEQIAKRMKLKKVRATTYHFSTLYPAASGMQMTFLDPATMLFGDSAAVKIALDTQAGEMSSLNSNSQIEDMILDVERGTVWSVLDSAGTKNMMRSALGDAAKLSDYDTVQKRLLGSRYTMEFNNGVNFNLDVLTSDNFTAAGLSSLVKAGMMYKKMSATGVEKLALDSLNVDNDNAKLRLNFKTDDKKFESLLHSDLFAAVSK